MSTPEDVTHGKEVRASAPRRPDDFLPTPMEMARDGFTGASLIAFERRRQIEREEFLADHDDGHMHGELASAGAMYALLAAEQAVGEANGEAVDFKEFWWQREEEWPWDPDSFNPKADPIDNLVRAGALIAAEIDRRIRARTAHNESERKWIESKQPGEAGRHTKGATD